MKIKNSKINKYDRSVIESKWQRVWEDKGVYKPDLDRAKKPFYNLMMFPYPSAEGMHVGNMYAFTGSDIYGRFKRMQGFDVFEPIGLDGFGIHSENYAIQVGHHPKEQAKISQENFYRQLRATGNAYDWSRTVETYDPDYYKWTQWIFIQLFKAGLAYRKKAPVNFCPLDKTVLADEQVIDGRCERCKSIVEKKELEQWFFKITAYADRLIAGLSQIDWTEKVKIAQRQWIGKSEGVMLRSKVKDMDIHFEMFDSVPQTFMAQTFTVIAPEHPKLYELVKGTQREKPVMEFVEQIKKKKAAKKFDIEKETEGIFTGRYIDYTPAKRLLPIWVASFVIAEYGTGVVNASAHDERDFAFAKKYNLPLHPVMFPQDPMEAQKVQTLEYGYHHAVDGVLVEPEQFKGREWGEVREDIINYIQQNGWGKRSSQYHLRDWLISRQRYWGPPIPMIFCEVCAKKGVSYSSTKSEGRVEKFSTSSNNKGMYGWFPVPDDQLPVLLPDVKDWKPRSSLRSSGQATSPLANHPEFYNVACPECGGAARRETDVSDTFLDSSWYFFRYISTESSDSAWDKERVKNWLPVHMYIGGAEHSVLHLLYTRFLWKVFYDLGYFDFSAKGRPASGWDEPFPRFYAHGLLIKEGAKMSKSRGNVVVPDAYIKKYGADTLRTYLMFLGPFSQGGDFYDSSIAGIYRFLQRVYSLFDGYIEHFDKLGANKNLAHSNNPIVKKLHQTIRKVTQDLENLRFNTAIAALMELLNIYYKYKNDINYYYIEQFLLLLAPFSPHLAEELWQQLEVLRVPQVSRVSRGEKARGNPARGGFRSVHIQPWPTYDPKLLEQEEVTIVVQVDGKVRDQIKMKNEKIKNKTEIEKIAKKTEKVRKFIEGKSIKKVIYVEGKIINFVTR